MTVLIHKKQNVWLHGAFMGKCMGSKQTQHVSSDCIADVINWLYLRFNDERRRVFMMIEECECQMGSNVKIDMNEWWIIIYNYSLKFFVRKKKKFIQ
jgi:hypothetical protein